jgi:predicted porin
VAPRTIGTASVTVASIGGDYKLSDKLGLYAGYYNLNYDTNVSSGVAAYTENYASLLLDYNLSKRTDVYLGGMQVTTGRASYANTNIVAAGMRHKF